MTRSAIAASRPPSPVATSGGRCAVRASHTRDDQRQRPPGQPIRSVCARCSITTVTNLDAEEPLTLADLMPAPTRRKPRRHWKIAGIAAVAVVVVAGAVVLALASRPGSVYGRAFGPARGEAARECRSAVESEAQRRATSANSDTTAAAATVAGVDVAEPVWKTPAWVVDATLRFTIMSILGQLPATVYVRCTATVSGGRVSTSITSR